MKHVSLVAIAIAATVAVSGCNTSSQDKGITSGTVTSKEHDEAKTTCSKWKGSGAKRKCVKWKYEPEEWEIDLKDGKRTGEVKVDQKTWDAYKVGDRYPRKAG